MIKEIKLKNFKCFEDFCLPLQMVNILTGVNGMGKSTIIQSLLLMRQSFMKYEDMKGLALRGEYISLGTAQDVLYEKAEEDEIGIGFKDELGEAFWEYEYLPDSDFLPVIREATSGVVSFLSHQLHYLSAYRIQPQDLYRIQNEEDIRQRRFGNNGEYALQYLGLYGDEAVTNLNVLIEDKLGNSLRNQTRLWLDKISPGVSPQVTINTSLRNAEVRYEFIEGLEKTKSYKSINVGFGITYVLPLIVAILAAQKGDVIIIENPEAHIHPAGQRMLGELIARAGAGGIQMIVETHSDHILNGVRLAVKHQDILGEDIALSYFYKDDTDDYRHKCVHPKILKDGRLDSWPDGFFDEWDKALFALL